MTLLKSELSLMISIHPPRVGRDLNLLLQLGLLGISIHPPRVGRDILPAVADYAVLISIHPPRVGRDSESAQFNL